MQKDGYTHTEGYAKAKILNDLICSVFIQDDSNQVPSIDCAPFPNILPIELNISGIRKILQDLDPSKAAGPHHIPAKFSKLFATELSPCLLLIYKSSLEQGTVPSIWKN